MRAYFRDWLNGSVGAAGCSPPSVSNTSRMPRCPPIKIGGILSARSYSEALVKPNLGFAAAMGKFFAVFLIFDIALYGVLPMAFGVPARRVIVPVGLLFIPALSLGPLLYHSAQYRDRPRLRAVWFAGPICLSLLLALPALDYWVFSTGMISQASAIGYLPYLLLSALIAFPICYFQALQRYSVRQPHSTSD
jgi:hypothetical protein